MVLSIVPFFTVSDPVSPDIVVTTNPVVVESYRGFNSSITHTGVFLKGILASDPDAEESLSQGNSLGSIAVLSLLFEITQCKASVVLYQWTPS